MQSRLKAFKAGNQVSGNQPDWSFCEMASCWFQQLRPWGFLQMNNCRAHMHIQHASNGWMHCVRETHPSRHSTCFQTQLELCIRKATSFPAFVKNHEEMEVLERGWLSWEEKGVEEPEQQEKPNHGNVSLALQTHRYLKVLLMEQQQSDGCKNFSSQGKT